MHFCINYTAVLSRIKLYFSIVSEKTYNIIVWVKYSESFANAATILVQQPFIHVSQEAITISYINPIYR